MFFDFDIIKVFAAKLKYNKLQSQYPMIKTDNLRNLLPSTMQCRPSKECLYIKVSKKEKLYVSKELPSAFCLVLKGDCFPIELVKISGSYVCSKLRFLSRNSILVNPLKSNAVSILGSSFSSPQSIFRFSFALWERFLKA